MMAQGCWISKYTIYVKVNVPRSCQWCILHLPLRITTLDSSIWWSRISHRTLWKRKQLGRMALLGVVGIVVKCLCCPRYYKDSAQLSRMTNPTLVNGSLHNLSKQWITDLKAADGTYTTQSFHCRFFSIPSCSMARSQAHDRSWQQQGWRWHSRLEHWILFQHLTWCLKPCVSPVLVD